LFGIILTEHTVKLFKNKKMQKLKKNHKRNLLLTAAFLTLVLLLALGLMYHSHNRKAVSGTIPADNPLQAQQDTPSDKTSPSTNTDNSSPDSNTTTDTSASLASPSGTFVSNHRPSLSGANGVPSSEQSVCNTTPGASCYITFTNGDIVKTLASQKANNNGVVIWNWDVKDAGFTEGSWQITATATFNGTTKSTNDSLKFEVRA
jgi:hypothetical protein